MSQNMASIQQLELAIKEIVGGDQEPTFEAINNLLATKNLFIDEKEFYKHLYSNHLYDWKKEGSVEEIQNERQTQEKIGELEKTLSQVRATLESTEDGILMLSREGKIVNFNQKFVQMFRCPPTILDAREEQVGLQYILDQVVDPQELFHLITSCYNDPTKRGDMGDLYFKDGRVLERYSQPHMAGDQIVGRVWSFRDVTGRRRQDQELRLRERAIQASTHGVIITDSDQKVIFANAAFERITGYSTHDIINQDGFLWCKTDKQNPALKNLQLALKENREDHDSALIHRKDGTKLWVEINIAPVPNNENKITHFVWIINDITQWKAMEAQLEHQTTHDSLTHLPNRVLLYDRLQQAILNAKRSKSLFALWFIDLDRFKLTNDGLGHAVGDGFLKEVAQRLTQCFCETDTIARVGGDEFVIISMLQKSEAEVIPLAQKILKKLAEPIQLDNRTFNITASIGISSYPKNGEDIETLMKSADIAMYRAKELGRDNFQFFTAEMNTELSKRLVLEGELHKAIAGNELTLHYQPLVDLKTGYIIAVEALLRWNHPQKGMISPADFIPIAEDSGLIIPIGEWALETACTHQQIWNAHSSFPIRIAVNISSQQLKRTDFLKVVDNILQKTGIPPQCLELELTESILIEDTAKTHEMLESLREKGITLAIDDFGTGYSSLSYLRHFPLNKLKIDKSFISKIDIDPNDAAIVQTIMAMGHIMGLKVLAEGVETESQLNFLKKYGCDEIQGFYFSKAVSEEHLIKMLEQNHHLPL